MQKQITDEHTEKGFNGRFGPGLPRVYPMVRCCSSCTWSARCVTRVKVARASASSSTARRCLPAAPVRASGTILAATICPERSVLTDAPSWVLSNHKAAVRQGKVQLIDGSQQFAKMRKSLGSKRQYITEEQIRDLVRLYGRFEETAQSKIFPVEAFGYRRITVERPLRLNFQVSPDRIEKVLEEKPSRSWKPRRASA